MAAVPPLAWEGTVTDCKHGYANKIKVRSRFSQRAMSEIPSKDLPSKVICENLVRTATHATAYIIQKHGKDPPTNVFYTLLRLCDFCVQRRRNSGRDLSVIRIYLS